MVSSALLLILVFALIGTLQFFTEPQILRPLSNGTITPDFTPNIYAFSQAFLRQLQLRLGHQLRPRASSSSSPCMCSSSSLASAGACSHDHNKHRRSCWRFSAASRDNENRRPRSANGRLCPALPLPRRAGRLLPHPDLVAVRGQHQDCGRAVQRQQRGAVVRRDVLAVCRTFAILFTYNDGIYLRWIANSLFYAVSRWGGRHRAGGARRLRLRQVPLPRPSADALGAAGLGDGAADRTGHSRPSSCSPTST